VDDPAAFPDSCYHDAVSLLVNGDEQGARRAIEEGLARASGPRHAVTRACLGDLGAQLDGEAALSRLARRTPGPTGWLANPDALARSVAELGRAHLVEAVIEEIAHLMPEDQLMGLVVAAHEARTPACHDLLVEGGYRNGEVLHLKGGLGQWRYDGYPIEGGKS
jgi:rhodanese-related sulfurtransferase